MKSGRTWLNMFAASMDLRAVFLFFSLAAHFDTDPLRVLNRLSHAAFRQIQSDILCTDPVRDLRLMVFHRRNDPNVGFWRWSHRLVGTSFFGGPNRMTSNFEKTSPKINMSPLKGSISRWEHVSPKQQFSAGNCSKFPRSSFVSYQLQFRESLVITVLTQLELLKPTFYLLLLLHFYLFFGKAPYLLNYTHTWNKTQFLRLCGLSEKLQNI